jgi:hypothetical protein
MPVDSAGHPIGQRIMLPGHFDQAWALKAFVHAGRALNVEFDRR